ncbi:restriction endonuclease [Paucibacter sp. M5-1]|uniref:restriction endonuclease n=1 Tax=Paucibacter sp. M5-1 TaxID=3015998 RepID=UPI0022B8686C|nr:restriction endonuclease [Paucibacter sp. M5-1]MCZ7881242.1 restriction endonuclease [Paucibacter sp. M5-1]
MKIFDQDPTDWRDLQNLVAQMFAEMGCTAEVGVKVSLVRGNKEIDVFVEDPAAAPPHRYLVECKLWKSRVSQETVHAFRTVVADCGAHRGYIVSSSGFQSGAYEAAQRTNVDLVTFDQLQQLLFDRWKASIGALHMPFADRLFPYWDPMGGKRPPSHWGDAEREQLHLLNDAYAPFLDLGPTVAHCGYSLDHLLPMTLPILSDDLKVVGELSIQTYRQFYDFIYANRDVALARYASLFAERPQ